MKSAIIIGISVFLIFFSFDLMFAAWAGFYASVIYIVMSQMIGGKSTPSGVIDNDAIYRFWTNRSFLNTYKIGAYLYKIVIKMHGFTVDAEITYKYAGDPSKLRMIASLLYEGQICNYDGVIYIDLVGDGFDTEPLPFSAESLDEILNSDNVVYIDAFFYAHPKC